MEKKTTIYTYGNENITAKELISLLQPYHVNCVVDCRPHLSEAIANNTPSDELRAELKAHNIHYIPFHQHFGKFPMKTLNKRGNIVYTKAIKTENFLAGVESTRNKRQQKIHTHRKIPEKHFPYPPPHPFKGTAIPRNT